MSKTPPCKILIPAEMEEYIKERTPDFLTRAVASAAKPSFAVEYKGKPIQESRECYDCEYCHRLRYLKGEWHCRICKPHEVPKDYPCFVRRGAVPSCFDCASWDINDPRCMDERSQWAGYTTSPDNYCRYFDRRSDRNE